MRTDIKDPHVSLRALRHQGYVARCRGIYRDRKTKCFHKTQVTTGNSFHYHHAQHCDGTDDN